MGGGVAGAGSGLGRQGRAVAGWWASCVRCCLEDVVLPQPAPATAAAAGSAPAVQQRQGAARALPSNLPVSLGTRSRPAALRHAFPAPLCISGTNVPRRPWPELHLMPNSPCPSPMLTPLPSTLPPAAGRCRGAVRPRGPQPLWGAAAAGVCTAHGPPGARLGNRCCQHSSRTVQAPGAEHIYRVRRAGGG